MALARRLIGSLIRGWRDSLYLHRRLLEAQRPWEQQGPLRWQRQRIVGSRLPENIDEGQACLPNDLAPK